MFRGTRRPKMTNVYLCELQSCKNDLTEDDKIMKICFVVCSVCRYNRVVNLGIALHSTSSELT